MYFTGILARRECIYHPPDGGMFGIVRLRRSELFRYSFDYDGSEWCEIYRAAVGYTFAVDKGKRIRCEMGYTLASTISFQATTPVRSHTISL